MTPVAVETAAEQTFEFVPLHHSTRVAATSSWGGGGGLDVYWCSNQSFSPGRARLTLNHARDSEAVCEVCAGAKVGGR